MVRPSSTPSILQHEWTNWSRSATDGPPIKFQPKTISDLVGIAKFANAKRRVKASGTRWSASAAARADSIWVDTQFLNRILLKELGKLGDELPAGKDATNFVVVQGGIKIHALATELWGHGKSIPSLGGSMGQSIAGAISTGVHGSDFELPPISGMVRAIHLVGPGGQEYWLEHPDWPVASRKALQEHYPDWHESIRYRRNAEAFNAALVGVGRCGFIYAYVLEVEQAFYLKQERIDTSWKHMRKYLLAAAASGDWASFVRSKPPGFPSLAIAEAASASLGELRAVQAVLNPDGGGQAWWVRRTKLDVVAGNAAIAAAIVNKQVVFKDADMSYGEQAHLVHWLANALDPGKAAAAGGVAGFLAGFATSGPWGGIVGAIAGAIAGGVTASSEDVFNCISQHIFPLQLGQSLVIDASFRVMSGTHEGWASYSDKYSLFWEVGPRAQYTEVFFDAQKPEYVTFIDNMLEYFATGGSGKQAGYIAIRFTGPSNAPLAMQRWPVTVSVEVALLDALDPNAKATIQHVNQLAEKYDRRYHWGMIRPPAPPNEQAQRELEQWKRGAAMLGVRARDGFSSEFSRLYGLEPSKRPQSDFLLLTCG